MLLALNLLALVCSSLALEVSLDTFQESFNRHKREAIAENAARKVRTASIYRTSKSTAESKLIGAYSKVISRVARELNMEGEEVISRAKRMAPAFPCPLNARGLLVGRLSFDRVNFGITCGTRAAEGTRRITAQCNNLRFGHWGAQNQPFRRTVPNTYRDGLGEPKNNLTSPRLISSTVHPDALLDDKRVSNMIMQIGQFIDHDLSLAPEDELECCEEEEESCLNIDVPTDDPFYSRLLPEPQTCLPFTRTTPICSGTNNREQFNVITSVMDLNTIYGSDETTEGFVRSNTDGLLTEGSTFPGALPTVEEATGNPNFEGVMGMFLSGDARVNEQPGLAVVHTVFFREHNRLARVIKQLRPAFNDDQIFQNARRINIAQWQQIVYGEFLPVLVGRQTADRFLLNTNEMDSLYTSRLNPGSFHAFSTAAYRFGHTMIHGLVQAFNHGSVSSTYALRNNFFASNELTCDNGEGLERLLEGLINQPGQSFDENMSEDVTTHLFPEEGHNFGQDLVARNLQRGRDHGIGTYATFRNFCRLPSLTSSWINRPDNIPASTWAQLQQVYSTPLEIELFSGGISEVPDTDAVVGQTFACLISYQMFLAKYGDRFFFTHQCASERFFTSSFDSTQIRQLIGGTTQRYINWRVGFNSRRETACGMDRFTQSQRNVIRKRTLGDIICDNTSTINSTTQFVHLVRSGSNRIKSCSNRSPLNVQALLPATGAAVRKRRSYLD